MAGAYEVGSDNLMLSGIIPDRPVIERSTSADDNHEILVHSTIWKYKNKNQIYLLFLVVL